MRYIPSKLKKETMDRDTRKIKLASIVAPDTLSLNPFGGLAEISAR